ncbi:MAG: hypothetical protein CVV56_02180 [Tenericutes bacterium HGW-Tenericutes-1]|jgi:small conductance mechanosensitive channel|nr:MAG: hypothetical protein CVV56_02180 [Tenericutes bacterium HGW-Tenericutes-1]
MDMFEFMREWLESILGQTSFFVSFIIISLYVIFWLTIGIVLTIFTKPIVNHFLKINTRISKKINVQRDLPFAIIDRQKRGVTISKALVSIFRFVIWFIIFIILLNGFGVNTAPILASAGVVGVAVAFGTQAIIKDFISGIFLIMENTISIGELVQIGGFTGTVKEIGLRTTKLEDWKGDYFIINNGSINSIINYSRDYSLAIIDITLGNEINYQLFQTKVKEFIEVFGTADQAMVSPLEYIGMVESGGNYIKVRIIGKTKPVEHFAFERLIREKLFLLCQENNIAVPIQKIEIVSGDLDGIRN